MLDKLLGPGLIGLAALLWATDTPFRYFLSHILDPVRIVLFEHLLAAPLLLAWIGWKIGKKALHLSWVEWFCVVLIGIGGSALATLLFTASFQHVNPSVAILLQKLQPIFVVLIAHVALGERPERRFYGWAAVALASATVLSVPHFDWGGAMAGALTFDPSEKGVLYAVCAAALWAGSTVAGKIALRRHSPAVVTFWRYFFAIVALFFLTAASGNHDTHFSSIMTRRVGLSILFVSWVSGLLSMIVYYIGLSGTTASVATFVELVYPISAIAMNTWILNHPLTATQSIAGCALILSVLQISR